jgi:hypothetical protein
MTGHTPHREACLLANVRFVALYLPTYWPIPLPLP